MAIQTAFEKEQQIQLQHEIQEVEQYLQQLLIPLYMSTLTGVEKDTLVQEILAHLWFQEDLPTDLMWCIQEQFTETTITPPPPKLKILNLDEILSMSTVLPENEHIVSSNDGNTINDNLPSPEDSLNAHIIAPESSPDATSLKSNAHLFARDLDI